MQFGIWSLLPVAVAAYVLEGYPHKPTETVCFSLLRVMETHQVLPNPL